MLAGALALATAAAFAGAAVYVSCVEHPARMQLDVRSALMQWKPSYRAGAVMQASLAALSGVLGIAACFMAEDWRWLVGAVLVLINWPYTFAAIMPTNNRLKETAPERAGEETRDLMQHWAHLHAVRSALGLAATAAYAWAIA